MTAESATPNPVSEIETIERVAQLHLEWLRGYRPPHKDGWWRGRPNPHSVEHEKRFGESEKRFGIRD